MGGARSWGDRAGLVSGLANSVQNPCVKRRGLCGGSWLGLGSGGVLYWAQNIFSCSLTSLVNVGEVGEVLVLRGEGSGATPLGPALGSGDVWWEGLWPAPGVGRALWW